MQDVYWIYCAGYGNCPANLRIAVSPNRPGLCDQSAATYQAQTDYVNVDSPLQCPNAQACSWYPFVPWAAVTHSYQLTDGATASGFCSIQIGPPTNRTTFPQSFYWDGQRTLPACPANSTDVSGNCTCNKGFAPNGTERSACVPVEEEDRSKKQICQPEAGNPILPLTGAKKERIDVIRGLGWSGLALTFDTTRRVASVGPGHDLADTELASFGELWLSSLHKRLAVGSKAARITRGDGYIVSFSGDGAGTFTPDADMNDPCLSG